MRRIKTILALALAVSVSAGVFQSCSDDDDDKNAGAPVPAAFIQALKQIEPDAKNVKWETEGVYRVAEFDKNGVEFNVWFDAKAAWAMTEKDFGRDFFLVPDNAVSTAFAKGEYGMWTVDDISYYKQLTDEFYIIEVETAGQPDMDLFYTVDGTMIKDIPSAASPDILPGTVVSR